MTNKLRRTASFVLSLLLATSLFALPTSALAEGVGASGALIPPDSSETCAAPETDGVLVVLESAVEETDAERLSALSADGTDGTLPEVVGDLEALGLEITEQMIAGDDEIVIAASAGGDMTDEEAARAAEGVEGVTYAQPNYVYEMVDGGANAASSVYASEGDDAAGISPLVAHPYNDPFALISQATGTPNQYWLYRTRLVDAWGSVVANGEVTIAVMDSGVREGHEDLADNVNTRYAWDATTGDPYVASEASYLSNRGHGTIVSGIAAGVANNGHGVAGGSYNASILPIRVFDANGKSSTIIIRRAFERLSALAKSGAVLGLRVVNMSLGSYQESVNDELLRAAIADARDKYGIVTVCAGGNGDSAGRPYTAPLYPSDFPECVSVTALTSEGKNVVWSDYNVAKDISAPGIDVWSTSAVSDDAYGKTSGTSAASPMVASTFALMFAAVPNATVDEACEAMYATAKPIYDNENDRSSVSGSHGALDAASAVERLVDCHPWQFRDAKSGDWFYEAVGHAAVRGVMSGYADGSGMFGVGRSMTREEAAQMLYNYLGNGAKAPAAERSDVRQGQWYSDAVNWAVETGAMTGYDGTDKFGVGCSLTREEAACMFAKLVKADVSSADSTKFDSLIGASQTSFWARDELVWAVDKGLIGGFDNGDGTYTLAPGQVVRREQMARIMMNAIDLGILQA